jgi:hypothetical protein
MPDLIGERQNDEDRRQKQNPSLPVSVFILAPSSLCRRGPDLTSAEAKKENSKMGLPAQIRQVR